MATDSRSELLAKQHRKKAQPGTAKN